MTGVRTRRWPWEDTETQREHHTKMEAETGVTHLWFSEHQELPAILRSQDKGLEQSIPQMSHKEPTVSHLDFQPPETVGFSHPVHDTLLQQPQERLICIKFADEEAITNYAKCPAYQWERVTLEAAAQGKLELF